MDLKRVRKYLGKSQLEFAELFNCTQAFISQIENKRTELPLEYIEVLYETYGEEKIKQVSNSKILSALGWKDVNDPLYATIKNQLLNILSQISQKTGFSNEEISEKIYRNKKTIPEALLNLEQVSPNMNGYILKRLDKVGLSSMDISLADNTMKNVLHFSSIDNFSKFQHRQEVAKAKTDINIEFIKCDYYVDAPFTLPNSFDKGDILAIQEIEQHDLVFNKIYLLLFKDGSNNIQYISQGKSRDLLRLSMEIPTKQFNDYGKMDIFKFFAISHVLKIETL